MRLSFVKNMGLLVLAVVGIASRADAGIITVPPDLAPGSQYRLVFVTAGTYNATSSSISTYNDESERGGGRRRCPGCIGHDMARHRLHGSCKPKRRGASVHGCCRRDNKHWH